MKIKDNNVKNPIKLAISVVVGSFIGVYAWMILLHIGVEVYESKLLGSRELGKAASENLFNNSTALAIISYVIMEIIIVLIAIFMVKRFNKQKFNLEHIGMKFSNNSIRNILIGFAIVSIMYILLYSSVNLLGIVQFKGYGFSDQSPLYMIGTVVLVLITTAFPGFCEEIVFRGVIQNYLMRKYSTPVAIIVSSLCFSILHVGRYSDLMSLLTIVIIGITLGYIFVKTKSLYLSIGIHFAWDFFGSVIGIGKSMFNTDLLMNFENLKNGDFIANLMTIVLFIGLLIAIKFIYKKFDSNSMLESNRI
ncbi:CPBP family intramembrane metalloprotease [Clostridium sp. YIM B02505]|uniref:CPBP family intramembrane metalloprotease n=1 Tax=Clostridium yunnanense TaxID=2800325 RepID=A0ABS1EM15_9CLOT|nr:CPBP family intramembrane glutamic endopeptidase [Clostridium yunnanense]MBK1810407.1 CPBP family intramembrane metalloprotease [Clostridium yunnanense]